jgi:hypothetical protein
MKIAQQCWAHRVVQVVAHLLVCEHQQWTPLQAAAGRLDALQFLLDEMFMRARSVPSTTIGDCIGVRQSDQEGRGAGWFAPTEVPLIQR